MGVIAGRWKVLILRELLPGGQRALVGISSKVLAEQLRQMEQDGIIRRQEFAELPLRVWAYTPGSATASGTAPDTPVGQCIPQPLPGASAGMGISPHN